MLEDLYLSSSQTIYKNKYYNFSNTRFTKKPQLRENGKNPEERRKEENNKETYLPQELLPKQKLRRYFAYNISDFLGLLNFF